MFLVKCEEVNKKNMSGYRIYKPYGGSYITYNYSEVLEAIRKGWDYDRV